MRSFAMTRWRINQRNQPRVEPVIWVHSELIGAATYIKSKRSRFITLVQAATKSRRKTGCASLQA